MRMYFYVWFGYKLRSTDGVCRRAASQLPRWVLPLQLLEAPETLNSSEVGRGRLKGPNRGVRVFQNKSCKSSTFNT